MATVPDDSSSALGSAVIPLPIPDAAVARHSTGAVWPMAPRSAPPSAAAGPHDTMRDRPARGRPWLRRIGHAVPSWLASAVLHAAALLALSLVVEPLPGERFVPHLEVTQLAPQAVEHLGFDQPQSHILPAADVPPAVALDAGPLVVHPEAAEPGLPDEVAVAFGVARLMPDAPLWASGDPGRGGLSGRQGDLRARLLADGGGDGTTEAAVRRGLRWLAAHQRSDGSWHFNHHDGPCRGQCRDPGDHAATTGATAVALLAFLGAGETHRQGEYQEVVRAGLYYLAGRMLDTPHGGDLQEGTMYAQGLATIVLCEAYALTGDRELKHQAQQAVNFVLYAQDPHGGGWRYYPGQPGDTTVHGWQMMALKAGQMGYLMVPSRALAEADRFLDTVESQDGAAYGYQTPGDGHSTTAIGLLCRMYGGWTRQRPALVQGVFLLDRWGPSEDDMYYNYYATQVLRHYGEEPWYRWNGAMKEQLLRTQASQGHEAGSWYFDNVHLRPGGRLLSTALCVMTLEVYYRYLPLYRDTILDEEWEQ